MSTFIKTGAFCTLLFFAGMVTVLGQTPTWEQASPDTARQVVILFPFDKSEIDSSYMDNSYGLGVMRSVMSNQAFVSGLDSITVTGGASPDGVARYNRLLAQRRAGSTKDFITGNYPYADHSIVSARAGLKYWEGLTEMVEADMNVPAREEFLGILKNPGLTDEEKNQMMNTMHGGKVFAYIRDNHFLRHLRSAMIQFYPTIPDYQATQSGQEVTPVTEPQPELNPEAVLEVPALQPDSTWVATDRTWVTADPTVVTQHKPVLALRTNLLLGMVGGPNLGIEIPVGKHFSVAGDYAFAYTRINNLYALQTNQGTLEARYWFSPRGNVLTGWNLGVYGTYCNRFDIQWGRGWQGDGFWSGGLTAGYSVPISKRFNLDFSVAGGYLYSPEIRQYDRPRDGHLMWEKTMHNASRFALTQVRVNLVWLINKKVR